MIGNDLSPQDQHDDAGIVFRDLLLLALAVFVVIAVLMLAHINAAKATRSEVGATPPGNVLVELTWPPEDDTDVDLWVQGPGDVPVGYSNKSGGLFNLLRDDLGHTMDVSGLNYESAYSRGVLPGEYTVNLHLYRDISDKLPIACRVVVSVRGTEAGSSEGAHQILMTDANLVRVGQELTVFRFRLDAKGALVSGSVNALQKPLRSGPKG